MEWSCKTINDTSANPPQRLLFSKDSAESGGYLVTLFDANLKQNMQFFGKGSIDSSGNGSVQLFDGSNIVLKKANNQVVTSVMLSILSCVKADSTTWAKTVGVPGAVLSCGNGQDVTLNLSKSNTGTLMLGSDSVRQAKTSSTSFSFTTSAGKSLEVTKQGPGIYFGLYNNGNPAEKIEMPCVGTFSLL